MYAAVYVGTADKSVPRKRIEDFVYLTQILRISGVGLLRGIRRGQHSGGAAAAVVDQRVVRAKYADLPRLRRRRTLRRRTSGTPELS